MTTQWNLETIGQFFESTKCNPQYYNKLLATDPIGRMWAAYVKSVEDFNAARHDHQWLGVNAISSDPTKATELEGLMTAALVTRDTMIVGIGAAGATLGDAAEPSTQY